MSLSTILDTKDARAFFRGMVRNPGLPGRPEIRVPTRAASPQRVGTAFDYALRFGLQARGRATLDARVARSGLRVMSQVPWLAPYRDAAQRCYDTALAALQSLTDTPCLSARAAEACFKLAALDVVLRAGRVDQIEQPTSADEVVELQALYRIVPWQRFRPRHRLRLNPTLGAGARLLGGADADLVLDDTLIEIKTIREQSLRIDTIRQLVGYALLANQYGLGADGARGGIERLGVYFSRAGVLHVVALADVIAPADHARALRFLVSQGLQWRQAA